LALSVAWPGSAVASIQGGDSLEVSVTEVWRTLGDPGFTFPRGMAQWPDGTVWIGDSQVDEVYQISAGGDGIRLALRSGEGPGEVGSVSRILGLPGGGMAVWEDRVGFFRPDKSLDRYERRPEVRGVPVALPGGGFVVAGHFGLSPGHRLARYVIHRYDDRLRHQKSWHDAADHKHWETAYFTAGGPVALTRDGGLLFSAKAPFRITRYADLDGAGAQLVVEDERIVSSSERDRAVTYGPGAKKTFRQTWSRSSFLHELEDGAILNVVELFPEEGSSSSLWIVVSPDGAILARTPVAKRYTVWNTTPDGHFLATYWDKASLQEFAAKLKVEVLQSR